MYILDTNTGDRGLVLKKLISRSPLSKFSGLFYPAIQQNWVNILGVTAIAKLL